MRTSITALAAVLGLSGTAVAYTSGGHSYELSCNPSGYVLTSESIVSRNVEAGAESRVWRETEILYLGRSCDARHELFGTGTWCWANGGFVADFDGTSFGFPRQALSCPTHDNLGQNCRC